MRSRPGASPDHCLALAQARGRLSGDPNPPVGGLRMSLDVYLSYPNHCATCTCKNAGPRGVFTANITHNLGAMAREAGIYCEVWRPEENGITKAYQLIRPLQDGIALMEANPDRFKAHDSPNGWGRYVDFLPWLQNYLLACLD